MLDPFTFRRQQLDEFALAGRLLGAGALAAASRLARGSAVHGHVCSSVCPAPGVAGGQRGSLRREAERGSPDPRRHTGWVCRGRNRA
ncbi:hypothetical protein GCM10018779_24870 [Streptomyces griseocarneus]|nr:hypothetical protein GCM10018779_24870 [Streptomyces griseocarneus]